MNTYSTINDIEQAILQVGDTVRILGERIEGDVPTMTGRVRAEGTPISNRVVYSKNGLPIEVFPVPATEATKEFVEGEIHDFHTDTVKDVWQAGQRITSWVHKIYQEGDYYIPKTVPFITKATWESDKENWVVLESEQSTIREAGKIYSTNFKTITDLKTGLAANGQQVTFSKMIGQRVEWRGYHEESDGGSNWGIVKQGVHVDDGGSIFSLSADLYVEANLKGKSLNVRKFGAMGNGTHDDVVSIKNAVKKLRPTMALFFPQGDYAISTMVTVVVNDICICGVDKRQSRIVPHDNWDHSDGLMTVGDGTTYSVTIKNLMFYNSKSEVSKNSDGLIIHSHYNFDIIDCAMTGGDYTTRETAGLRILGKPLHTRVDKCQLHNNLCYSVIIHGHLSDLSFTNCAINEAPVGIKSLGDIVEMRVNNCGFGSAWHNPWYPTPSERINIDLTVGRHGTITINGNTFTGGAGTYYHVKWNYINIMTINGNTLRKAERFSLCANSEARSLTVIGNCFELNGTAATTTDPSKGIRNADTTPFCTDIYLHTVFKTATVISSNTSSQTDRPILWGEGSSSMRSSVRNILADSNLTMVANSSEFKDIAYVHGTIIKSTDALSCGKIVGSQDIQQLSIAGRTLQPNSSDYIQLTLDNLSSKSVITYTVTGAGIPIQINHSIRFDTASGFARLELFNMSNQVVSTGQMILNVLVQ